MRLVFSPEARLEFDEAERYYRLQLSGLELKWREEIRNALRRLRAWPLAFPVERGDIRRVLLRRFPYKLLYSYRDGASLCHCSSASASHAKLLVRPQAIVLIVSLVAGVESRLE